MIEGRGRIRWWVTLAAVLLMWLCVPQSTAAAEAEEATDPLQGYVTEDDGSGGLRILQCNKSDRILTIPGESADGKLVTAIGEGAFRSGIITSVTIPPSVKTIEDEAFYSCSSLESVTFSGVSALRSIGDEAFAWCNDLVAIQIPDTVSHIGTSAFEKCTRLSQVHIPSSLSGQTERVFYGDTALTGAGITWGQGIRRIGGGTAHGLFGGSGLKEIELPEGVRIIDSRAFRDCASLVAVSFPTSLEEIGQEAFSGCAALERADLSGGAIAALGEDAFGDCTSLASVRLPSTVAQAISPFKGCAALEQVELTGTWTQIPGPASDGAIGGLFAFSGIRTLELPATITALGREAFRGCTGLREITIPEAVTEIGQGAFYGCAALTALRVPDGVSRLGESVFYGCTSLSEVALGRGIREIPLYAFGKDSSLEELVVPYGVEQIRRGAFLDCKKLKTLFVPSSVTIFTVEQDEFGYGDGSVPVLYVEAGVSSAARSAGERYGWEVLDGIWAMDRAFPDEVLRERLVRSGCDTDGDTRLTLRETERVTQLQLGRAEGESPIVDVTGLELFTGLRELDLSGNGIVSLATEAGPILAGFPELIGLDCSDNGLEQLQLSGNPKLESLKCSGNSLLALDLSANRKLLDPQLGDQSRQVQVWETESGGRFVNLRTLCGDQYVQTAITLVEEEGTLEGEAPALSEDGIVWAGAGAVPESQSYRCLVHYGLGATKDMPVRLEIANAGIAPDSLEFEESWPDGNLRTRVAALLDSNGNGLVSRTEERSLKKLSVPGANISSAKGIERLWGLEELYVENNGLTELELSGNPKLRILEVQGNSLSVLDLSGNPLLEALSCGNNRLKSLELGGNAVLRSVAVGGNQLATLDIGANAALRTLEAGEQRIGVRAQASKDSDRLSIDVRGDYDADFTGAQVASVRAMDREGKVCADSAEVTETGFRVPRDAAALVYVWSTSKGNMTVNVQVGDIIDTDTIRISLLDSEGNTLFDPIEVEKGQPIGRLPVPYREGFRFLGWYTERNGAGSRVEAGTVLTEQYAVYAHFEAFHAGEVEVLPIPDVVYSGAALTPRVHVYDGAVELIEGKDYTVRYRNNRNAGTGVVQIRGKGNYTEVREEYFKILPKPLTDEDILVDERVLAVYANGRLQRPEPKLSWGGTKLNPGTEYRVTWPDEAVGAYVTEGSYTVRISAANGNFTGERDLKLVIIDRTRPDAPSVLLGNATVKGIEARSYTGTPVTPEPSAVIVGGKRLVKGRDYTLDYVNNDSIGVASVRIVGTGICAGVRTVNFRLRGTSMSRTSVTGLTAQTWDGTPQKPVPVVRIAGENTPLIEGVDYEVEYQNNTDKGTATVVLAGMGRMTGTIRKNFKIKAYDISTDAKGLLAVEGERDKNGFLIAPWERSGARPKLVLRAGSQTLVEGTDYILRYADNKRVWGTGIVRIKGKNNLKGTREVSFLVTQGDLGVSSAMAGDVVYNGKAGRWISTPILRDSAGTKLVAGTNYDKAISYLYQSVPSGSGLVQGAIPLKSDRPPVGTVISATASGKGNYAGTTRATSYRVVWALLSKAKLSLNPQEWTGDPVTLDGKSEAVLFKRLPMVAIGGTEERLVYGTDFIAESYKSNINRGTASVTLRGISDKVGGTKTVKFKIVARDIRLQ